MLKRVGAQQHCLQEAVLTQHWLLLLRLACHEAPLLLPTAAEQQCWWHCGRLLLHVLLLVLLARLLTLGPRLSQLGQLRLALQSRHRCRCHQQPAVLRAVLRHPLPGCAARRALLLRLAVC
jgi:hypothetical protein